MQAAVDRGKGLVQDAAWNYLPSCGSVTSRWHMCRVMSMHVRVCGVKDKRHTHVGRTCSASPADAGGSRVQCLACQPGICPIQGLALTNPGVCMVCPQVANMGNFPDFEDQYEMFEALRVMHVTITMEGVSKSPAYTQMLLTALGLPLLRRLKVVGGVDEAFGDPVPAAAAGAGEGLDASGEDEDEHDTGSSSDEE